MGSLKSYDINTDSFEKQMMDTGRFPNIAAGFILLMYIFYFSGIPFNNPSAKDFFIFFGITAVIIPFFQFFVAPRTNHLIVRNISNELEQMKDLIFPEVGEIKEDKSTLNTMQRTKLLIRILKLPIFISLQVCIVFTVAFGIVLFTLIIHFNLQLNGILFTISGFIFGNYFTGLLSYSYAEELCHHFAEKLIMLGIDEKMIHEKKYFGMNFRKRIIFFIAIPFIASNLIVYLFLKFSFTQNISSDVFIFNTIFLILLNTVIVVILTLFVYIQYTGTNHKINKNLEKFLIGNSKETITLPVNLGSEMSYNVFLVNNIIKEMQGSIEKSRDISSNIDTETHDLTSMAEEIVHTADSLSFITSKTNASMQSNVKRQIDIISKHTNDVNHIANVTKNNVTEGFQILNEDIIKYGEINSANIETITHIKFISEMIEKVWESIKKIDTLAARTKVIAFNAELEATAAGSEGENFHIVANEIRRLADSISDSTSDIKEKIKSIQDASDNLIVTSEAGTLKIREGSIFFSTLEEKFKELKLKSEITAEYSNEIQEIISSQDSSFVQISATLAQINKGFKEFSDATKTLIESSEDLNSVVFKLQHISKNKISEISESLKKEKDEKSYEYS